MELEEILQLKEKRKQEFDKDMEAINRVLAMLGKTDSTPTQNNGSAPLEETSHSEIASDTESNSDTETETEEEGSENDLFVRPTVRKIKDQLPSLYTKYDVRRILYKYDPRFKGKVRDNALYGAMKMLVREKFGVEVEKGAGRKAAVYRRISEE